MLAVGKLGGRELNYSSDIDIMVFYDETRTQYIGKLSAREFFVRFISVSGIGPKAALRALTQPIPVIAKAIDEGNMTVLRSLPGVGEQRAKEIVAKLQGKVGKYALLQTKGVLPASQEAEQTALEDEAVAILIQLEYKRAEAKQMVQEALKRNPKVKTSEELLNAVYRQQRMSEPAQVGA